jgi:hypothetical protein
LLVGSFAAGLFVAACADIFGIHNADVDGSAGDGGAGDVVADVPYDYNVFDAVDFDVNTAVCGDGGVPFVADAGDAVWVSANTGSDSNACTQASPCQTIGKALGQLGTRTVVYLDDSTFNEVVTLTQAGVTLQGGWVQGDAGWTAVCNNTGSIIQGPADAGPAAVEVTTSNVTMRLLTVRSKQQGAQGQNVPTPESVFAIRANNAPSLTLDNVTVIAQNAGGGQPGSTPNGSVPCMPFGGDGGGGTNGSPGPGGSFVGNTFNVQSGGTGTNGSAGVYTGPGGVACSNNCNRGCP